MITWVAAPLMATMIVSSNRTIATLLRLDEKYFRATAALLATEIRPARGTDNSEAGLNTVLCRASLKRLLVTET